MTISNAPDDEAGVVRPLPFPASASSMSDVKLLERVAGGQIDALDQLYAKYAREVFGVARAVVSDRSTAEDVTHDVFLSVWQGASSYDPSRGAFAAWLMRIARNRAIDVVRRNRTRSKMAISGHDESHADLLETILVDPGPDPAEEVVTGETRTAVRNALLELRPADRQLLEMAYYRGMTQRQIAQQIDRPLGTVKTHIRLAMKQMAESLRATQRPETGTPAGGQNER